MEEAWRYNGARGRASLRSEGVTAVKRRARRGQSTMMSGGRLAVVLLALVLGVNHAKNPADVGLRFTVVPPSSVVVSRGQSTLIPCEGQADSEPVDVSWTLWKGPEVTELPNHAVLVNGSLLLERRRRPGNYSCLLRTSQGALASPPVAVFVARLAKTFHNHPQSLDLYAGDTARFWCQIFAVPPANITWHYNGRPLINSSRASSPVPGLLYITSVLPSDTGNYHCVAESLAGQVNSSTASLAILSGKNEEAKFLSPPAQHLTVVFGKAAIFECSANPSSVASTLTWQRADGAPLSSYVQIQPPNLLVLNKTYSSDGGVYVCRGPGGVHERQASLTVLSPPVLERMPRNQMRPAAQTARFECLASGATELLWLKDGQPLRINGRVRLAAGELVISQTVAADSGIYQCLATNPAGVVWAAARLTVITPKDQIGAPQHLMAHTLNSSAVLLQWDPPEGRVQAYTIHYVPSSGGNELQQVAVSSSYVVSSLRPYTNYSFYVRAYSEKSASEQSGTIVHSTSQDVPVTVPKTKIVVLGPKSARIDWQSLSSDQIRGRLAGFRLHFRPHGQLDYSMVALPEMSRHHVLTDLMPGGEYEVRVIAGTDAGFPSKEWPWSKFVLPEMSAFTVPLAPILHLTMANDSAILVEWHMPSNNIHQPLGYTLSCDQNPTIYDMPANQSAILLTLNHSNDEPWHEVRLAAIGQNGKGPEALQILPLLSPLHLDTGQDVVEPINLTAVATSPSSVQLTWLASSSSSFSSVKYCNVAQKKIKYILTTKSEVLVSELEPFQAYEFWVKSYDLQWQPNQWSSSVDCHTLEAVPGQPVQLNWQLHGSRLQLSWNPPNSIPGQLTRYEVQFSSPKSTWQHLTLPGTELCVELTNFSRDTQYHIQVRAATGAGYGPPSSPVSVFIPPEPLPHKWVDPLPQGHILAVAIGVAAMVVCCALLLACHCHRRFGCPKQNPPTQELDCFSPMLTGPEPAKQCGCPPPP